MNKRKHAKGLCGFFACQTPATIRYATPGCNELDNEEQIFCDYHWAENLKVMPKHFPERVSRISNESAS